MAVENELPDMAVPVPRSDPALLEAELFGLEETLNILRAEFSSAAPSERVHVVRHMRDTRARIARIRIQLLHGY